MAGNYNKGHEFDLVRQVAFGSFMARSLKAEDMPWSINAGNKFYDYFNYQWFTTTLDAGGMPVRDAILDPDQICIYSGTNYEGIPFCLPAGDYNNSYLQSLPSFTAGSMMVPFDFKATIYTEADLSGTSIAYTQTIADLSSINVHSIKVEFLNTY